MKKTINNNKKNDIDELGEQWPDEELCPCGSGKTYKNCCKKKRMVYYKTENEEEYIKPIPIHPEVEKAFKIESRRHKEIFGREVGENDYIAGGFLESDFEKMLKELKRSGIVDNDWLYAVNKTGLMLSPDNKDLLSDLEIKEFNDSMKEYKRAIKSKFKNNKINILKAIELTNNTLDSIVRENIENMEYVLKNFIRTYSAEKSLKETFLISDIKDFFVFCAYKTSIYLETIEKLLDEDCYDVVMGIDRILFEILINIRTYKNNLDLFEKKILPVAGLDRGTHIRKGKHEIEEIETGKTYKYEIQKFQLAEKAGENYQRLYDVFYREMSEFIHVDAVAAKNIFKQSDMFFNLDESLIAIFIGMIFILEIIMELTEFDGCDEVKKSDMKYFSNKLLDTFYNVVRALREVEDRKVYGVLADCLKEYKDN